MTASNIIILIAMTANHALANDTAPKTPVSNAPDSSELTTEIQEEESTVATTPVSADLGDLYVTSNPSGAKIFVNDADTNHVTPALVTGLAVGSNLVRIATDCAAEEHDVTIGKNRVERLDSKLVEGVPKLNITTTPPDALVQIDRIEVGNSPLIPAYVTCGEHEITINLEGYHPYSESVITAAFVNNSLTVELQLMEYGSIAIIPDPIDANIILDGKDYGSGPMTLDNILVGNHEVVFRNKGTNTNPYLIEIVSGQVGRLEQALAKPVEITEADLKASKIKAKQAKKAEKERKRQAKLVEKTKGTKETKETKGTKPLTPMNKPHIDKRKLLLRTSLSVSSIGFGIAAYIDYGRLQQNYPSYLERTGTDREEYYKQQIIPYRNRAIGTSTMSILLGITSAYAWSRGGIILSTNGSGLAASGTW